MGGAEPDDGDAPFVALLSALSGRASPLLDLEELRSLRDFSN